MRVPSCALLGAVLLASASASSLRVPHVHLYPRGMDPRTRASHTRMVRSWREPEPAAPSSPLVTPVTFGADPTGMTDSSPAFSAALAAVLGHATGRNMSDGIADLGGVVLDLQGGIYLLSRPLIIPQFVGNLRIIDGTLRAAPAFPPTAFLLQVGASPCSTPSGQGSCNENVGMSGLTLDGSHVAAGCLLVASTMGSTLDASSAVFGFTARGILLQGGHEVMISETWVAAYFWSSPLKEKNNATGIVVAGNDHFLDNIIVFSARVGVELTGAANKVMNVHTWNCATGNGGIGILNRESQNIFVGIYMDFTDLVLRNAQQLSISNGFFLGGAQIIFEATKANDTVLGVSIAGNVWYDCDGPSLAVNETAGSFTSVTDFDFIGTAFCGYSRSAAAGLTFATQVFTWGSGGGKTTDTVTFDFSDALLFPSAGIASATVRGVGTCGERINAPLPGAGKPLTIAASSVGCTPAAGAQLIVAVDQSARSTTSAGGVAVRRT